MLFEVDGCFAGHALFRCHRSLHRPFTGHSRVSKLTLTIPNVVGEADYGNSKQDFRPPSQCCLPCHKDLRTLELERGDWGEGAGDEANPRDPAKGQEPPQISYTVSGGVSFK